MGTIGPTRRIGAMGVMAEQVTARSPHGVVAAAAPMAARLAAQALDEGGNVADAVLTAVLAETVLLPPKCGPAGDLIALFWLAEADEPEALLAIGGAPAGLEAEMDRLRPTGPLSVGVPGAPAGYQALAERSLLGVDRAAGIAEAIAANGFAWSTVCTVLTEESIDLLREHQPDGCVYLPGDRPIPPGTTMTLPGLGVAVSTMARTGPAWSETPIADAVLNRVSAAGGILTRDDLRSARAEWVPANSAQVDPVRLFATPAPTHGASLIDAMSTLDGRYDQRSVHTVLMDAIRRSRANLADPSGTSMVSAVDRWGNAAVVVHSNSFPQFGSGLVVSEYDLILANRAGRGFSNQPGHPNSPVAGRRPATTLHAWAFRAPDGTRVLGATPGGANQMPWNVQTLSQIAASEWAADERVLADSVVGPRWQWNPSDDSLVVEEGFDDESIAGLNSAAQVSETDRWGLRSAMQIVAAPPSGSGGTAVAIADPRTQAATLPV